ncbi:MFS transporter [Nodularia sphaerocarpa]|uniref:MFS transporter n=1 Tax=Nodularia sphaerocarpa TaxID=137816 RepID=UPI001EFB9605|nr:MFS transporter [Nodularia sphaerocarpa]MDB9373571.1 MFS transporter [Nodularia sphaerocarpa CS-585]MDB9379470.1 MFS transporter [Nodularia sphaerocarpa CS-585A2]ULP74359.1 MFS transporter [Nodularia sphaerocarpa UHCC 0038]
MEKTPLTIFREMKLFIIVWVGQLIASIGSSITGFALNVWVYEHTGSVTQFAFVTLFNTLPLILLAPIAGLMVDRWDRRWTMILSDFFASLAMLSLGVLFFLGRLEIWHIYLANLFSAIFMAFQIPAFIASITLLVPKQHLGRANGMLSLMNGIARLIAPPLGGILLGTIYLQGIIVLHLITIFLGIAILLLLRFPEASPPNVAIEETSFIKETTYGFTYLVARPGLLALLIISASSIFLVGGVQVITTPLVLSFAPVTVLGTILSLFGVAVLLGGLLIGIWGGLQRKMNMIYGCMLLTGFSLLVAGLQPSVIVFIVGVFLFFLIRPIIDSSTQAIFQSKVEPNVQGRVFSMKGAMEAAGLPLGYITIGPLAEKVFEPLMATDGLFADSIGQIIGVGAGRGMGLLLMIMGIFTICATCIAYFFHRLRFVEDELPDVIDALAISSLTSPIPSSAIPEI